MSQLVPTFIAACLAATSATGCAAFNSAKPVLRTADDIAGAWCASHFAETSGLSVEDAAKTFCATEAQLRPWLRLVLSGQRDGIDRAGVCKP